MSNHAPRKQYYTRENLRTKSLVLVCVNIMAKTKKKNTKPARQRRVRQAPIPRALRLTPTGASLAAYHAALSDPFASPPTFIPIGTRPGTFVHKRLITTVAAEGVTKFTIKLSSNASSHWAIDMLLDGQNFNGDNWLMEGDSHVIDQEGKVRIVGAAVRVTSLGRAENSGGLATLINHSSLQGTHSHKSNVIYNKAVTAHYKPIFPADFSWYGGNNSSDNDGYGDIYRDISVKLDPAVASKSFVEFVVLFENDEQMQQIEGHSDFLVGRRVHTHDSGPEAKQIAQRAVAGHRQRPVDMRNHNSARGPSYMQRLADGVKAATETGATVMGVVENLAPGVLSNTFKEYVGLGAATEAEVLGAATEALPMLEAAIDFAPLAIMGL